ncbi:MAG: hypothetical protein JRD68_00650, partial [Deltaproteobacteria bacterium]|nr:hypothetical protein [Deltaproteobacteria bacterium]
MREKIKINGVKLSEELTQINVLPRPESRNANAAFLRIMAENRINIPFLSVAAVNKETREAYCILAEDTGQMKAFAETLPELSGRLEYIHSVGSLSVFPHDYSLQLLGMLMHLFGKTNRPVYG